MRPSMSGLSWFGVLSTASLPSLSTTSQAQPEPKRVAPALRELLLERGEAAERAVDGLGQRAGPAPSRRPGVIISQNRVWL